MTREEFNEYIALQFELQRMQLGISQQDMATRLGLSLSAYKRIQAGTVDKIDAFAIYRMTSGDNESMGMMFKMARMPKHQREFLKAIIDFEGTMTSICSQREIPVIVPTQSMADGMIWDSADIKKADIPAHPSSAFGLQITSNHFTPVYTKGDILLIERRPIRDGDTGIFVNTSTGRAYIRTYRVKGTVVSLDPINAFGEAYEVDSTNAADVRQWYKFGVVVSRVR